MDPLAPPNEKIRIEERPGRGRCVVAARDLPPGELVLFASTAAALPSGDNRCMSCFATAEPGAELSRCRECKTAYCGAGCQKRDWKAHHRAECPLLRTFKTRGSEVPPPMWVPLLLAARVYRQDAAAAAAAAAGEAVPLPIFCEGVPLTPATLAGLRALHEGGEPGKGDVDAMAFARARAIVALARRLGAFPTTISDADAERDQRVFAPNNCALTDATLDVAGFGVYPTGALLNHSCTPNAALSYAFAVAPGVVPIAHATSQLIRTLVPVRAGEELTHSYVDATKTVEERRAELHGVYGFKCECSACVEEEAAATSAAVALDTDVEAVAARARLMVEQSRTIATEPDAPLTGTILAAMREEGANPPPMPIRDWQSEIHAVLALELSVLTHGVRLLTRAPVSSNPFSSHVMRGVHATLASALASGSWPFAEAAGRHLLSDLAARHTLRARGVVQQGPQGTPMPPSPLFSLQLVPLGDLYAAWAQELEVAAAAAAPGRGQAAALMDARSRPPLIPLPLTSDVLTLRDTLAEVFYGGAEEALSPSQLLMLPPRKELTTSDLRLAAATLYEAAAAGITLAFGEHAPYGVKQRKCAAAQRAAVAAARKEQ